MTTPHRTLQMALDALDAITDDVDGTGLNTMPSFDKAIDAIAALREALAAPQPEPVALESVHLTRDTREMCVVRVNGRVAIRDNGDIIDHMATLEWFAAPPAAPAPAVPAAPVPDGMVMVPRKELGDGISLLHQAMVGACDCLIKTHEAKYHAESCFYRRLSEQCDKLEATIAASPAAPVVREPFSRAQLHRLYVNSPELHKDTASEAAFTRIVQLTEAAHGITGGKP